MRKVSTIGATRQEALRNHDGKYYGSPCKKDPSHGNLRITNGGGCVGCQKVYQVLNAKRHYAKNQELYKSRAKKWAADNPEARSVALANNREKFRDERNAYNRAWFKNNPALRVSYYQARRAYRGKATIPGYGEQLQAFYENCPEGFTVDHIVPLKGRRVCGLHVPWNLQYLTPTANFRKNAYFDETLGIAPLDLIPVPDALPTLDAPSLALAMWATPPGAPTCSTSA